MSKRRGKSPGIVAIHDELSVILAHNISYISDVDRCNGAARRHRLEQCIRHLLCIGRQRKDVKRAKYRRGVNLTGEDDAIGDS